MSGRAPRWSLGIVLALVLSIAAARVIRGAGERWDLPPPADVAAARVAEGPFVVNLWATWCTACRVEIGSLHALAREAGIPVVGVNVGDRPEDIERWFARYGDPYRAHLDDAGGAILARYRVQTLPVTLVVGRDREIRLRIDGALTPEIVRQRVLPDLRTLGS